MGIDPKLRSRSPHQLSDAASTNRFDSCFSAWHTILLMDAANPSLEPSVLVKNLNLPIDLNKQANLALLLAG